MSYDLMLFLDPAGESRGREVEYAYELGDVDEERVVADLPQPEPGPALAALIDALGRRWPAIGEAGSPWATWLPDVITENAVSLNLFFDAAEEAVPEIVRIAHEHGAAVYDPQDDSVNAPG